MTDTLTTPLQTVNVNAKSLLGIMSLGIVTGATVTLVASGNDEQEAVDALEALLLRDTY